VGEEITIKALARLVQQVVGFDGEVVWDNSRPDGTPRKLMDVSKLKQPGWQSRISLEEGVSGIYQCYAS
jgi:GDP-L-fucose synthase